MGLLRVGAMAGVAILALSACNKAADSNGAAETAQAPAGAAAAPQIKPGLWETTTEGAGPGPQGGFTLRMCYDEAMAKEVDLMRRRGGPGGGGPGDGPDCQQTMNRQADGSWQGHSTCNMPFGTMTSDAVIRGDFNSAYTVEVTSKAEGEDVPPFLAEPRTMTISAKRIGDCPAGYAGGDVEDNGQKVTAAEREQRQAERRERFQQGGGGFGPGGPGGPPPAEGQ